MDKFEACWLTLRMTLKMAEEINPSASVVLKVMDDVEKRVDDKFSEEAGQCTDN